MKHDGDLLRICVTNSGIGLKPRSNARGGVGLRNIEARLKLHYGADATFEIAEIDQRNVKVSIVLPLQFLSEEEASLARLGAQ